MIMVIDNYDSFVYNLSRLIRLTGVVTEIIRNDQISITDILAKNPTGIVLSPGPSTPQQAGICVDLVKTLPHIPILGVCLGHQVIGEAYGGVTRHAQRPLHGQATDVYHDGAGLLSGLPSPLTIGLYHSLVTVFPQGDVANTRVTGSQDIEIQSVSGDGDVMAIRHRRFPHYGIQWHPESVLTDRGGELLKNFTSLCGRADDLV